MPSLLTYWHTLRHLKPIQLYGRIRYRLVRPGVDLRPAAPLRSTNRRAWAKPAARRISLVGAERFCFLNETHNLVDLGWDDPALEKLWRYNLHYFDDLNAQDALERTKWHRALLSRWVRDNPPGIGTGWEPYPTSLRIVNWIKWALGGNTLPPECVQSLAVQARWLSQRLEIHLLGNHLFANAKALVFAGVFFDGPVAEEWLKKGLSILEREVQEQVLSDGGHFERSPMYHALALEDVLDLINLSCVTPAYFGSALVERLPATVSRMLRWLRVMTHPDGKIALLNDAAFGIAPDYVVLTEYARRLAVPVEEGALGAIEALPDSGYVRLQNARAVVICDVAPVGPDYLPGHAHADTLSFELSLDGQRVLVNGGTSTYEPGPERQRQRGTAAHNTLAVDGQDSSEVWCGFRVARRARPFGVCWGEEDGGLWLRGAHDGYRRLPGCVIHHRRWVLHPNGLTIEDRVEGRFRKASLFLHVHPEVAVREDDRPGAVFRLISGEGGQVRLWADPPTDLSLARSTWHPEFGRSVGSTIFTASLRGESSVTRLSW
jgi:uncharacterized heparinase superfamily protein